MQDWIRKLMGMQTDLEKAEALCINLIDDIMDDQISEKEYEKEIKKIADILKNIETGS